MACGGRAYGYIAARDVASGEREVHPEQAETVRRIFQWFADGKSPRWIAGEWNRLGIPSPGASSMFGGKVPLRPGTPKAGERPYLIARVGLNRSVLLQAAASAAGCPARNRRVLLEAAASAAGCRIW
jgi:hypothetical protein